MIGKLQRVPLREVWKHEAHDFTQWLQQNLEVLNDVLDLTLTNAEREASAGAFNVDLVAEDESGGTVVIENQLEKSDHDHLGKLITYLTAMNARAAIWIVADPRPEHVGAITWLNEAGNASFYLVKLEAIRIGESPPAPLLTLIVGPTEEGREVGQTKKNIAERYGLRHRFWTQLLEKAKTKTKLHATISPGEFHWIGTGAGMRGLAYNYVVWQDSASAELYIDRGKDAGEENKAIFDALAAEKDTIETAVGRPIEWQRLDAKRASRIRITLTEGGYRDDEAKWPAIQDAMIDAMVRLEKARAPRIPKLRTAG
jgi:Domain of unknown function (DUF4268)